MKTFGEFIAEGSSISKGAKDPFDRVARKHGWDINDVDNGHVSYYHGMHPGHVINVDPSGKWTHDDGEGDEVLAHGKTHQSLDDHLSRSKKQGFWSESHVADKVGLQDKDLGHGHRRIPAVAKSHEKYWQGYNPELDVHEFEFPNEDRRQHFLTTVGGTEHPLGGLRTILSDD